MSSISVSYDRVSGETAEDAYNAARELLEDEKAKHQDASFGEASWTSNGITFTATAPVTGGSLTPEPEEDPEPTTCESRTLLGKICGRNLPCRWHK